MTTSENSNSTHGKRNPQVRATKPASPAIPVCPATFPVDLEIFTVWVAKPVMAVMQANPNTLVILDILPLAATRDPKSQGLSLSHTEEGHLRHLHHKGQLS